MKADKSMRKQTVAPKEADSQRRAVSIEEAARQLGVSRGSAYTAARKGELQTIRIGKRLLVPKVALERLLG
jgi:excisionase family DNA binding protein